MARWPAHFGLVAVAALAAFDFLWQLGSSSYYVDEADSLDAALNPLGNLLHAVSRIEISPPAYFVFLHEWLFRLGSGTAWLHHLAAGHEWLARLPSAFCGLLLVGAVYWLCSLVSERPEIRLCAAALAALSPFVLEYAQLAQPYIFAALAVTVAVAAGLEATRTPWPRTRWLVISLAAAVLAICLHYTAAVVIAPLCVWLVVRSPLSPRWRVAFPATILATGLALLPLLISQHHAFPNRPGVADSGAVSWATVASMLEVPFTGRVDALRGLGVGVMLVAFAVAVTFAWKSGAIPRRRQTLSPRQLIVVLAAGVPVCLLVLSILGGSAFWGHLMLPRYAAVAAPLMIVTVALALEALPPALAGVLAACAVVVCIAGLVQSHRPQGFYLDARDAVHYVQRHAVAGDAVAAPSDPVAQVPLMLYGLAALHPRWSGGPTPDPVLGSHAGRVWVISELPTEHPPSAASLLAFDREVLKPFGEVPLAARVFPGIPGLAVVLLAPRPAAGG